ncbi:MAG TPA: esterase-like activity of phytase family protein [Caulobacteraceae bacterium]
MKRLFDGAASRLTLAAMAALTLASCLMARAPQAPAGADGWTPVVVRATDVQLGPVGAELAEGVRFMGGLNIRSDEPLWNSLSDIKRLPGGGFVTVSDQGDLGRFEIELDAGGRLRGVSGAALRDLTGEDEQPLTVKAWSDSEGLAVLRNGDLLVSFERNHRIWTYGPGSSPAARPYPVRGPDFAFTENDGMEGIASDGADGWIATGESGGVWRCNPAACTVLQPPPATPLEDRDLRITGIDKDPAGPGWFVVQRSFSPPFNVRGVVRRMAADGTLGPILIDLRMPAAVDNFEGVAAVPGRGDATRLYILSDDNASPTQRTLLHAFDVPVRASR